MRRVASWVVGLGVVAVCAGSGTGNVLAGRQKNVEASSGWVKTPAAGETSAAAFVAVDNPTQYRRLPGFGRHGCGRQGGVPRQDWERRSAGASQENRQCVRLRLPRHGPEGRVPVIDGSQAAAQGRRHGIADADNRRRGNASGFSRRAQGVVASPTRTRMGLSSDSSSRDAACIRTGSSHRCFALSGALRDKNRVEWRVPPG